MKIFLTFICLSAFISFGQNKYGIQCQLIQKPLILTNGEVTETMEFYLRCSAADHFIKLCESTVTEEDLIKYLDQGLPAELEIREGAWDICEDDPKEMQSRVGTYVIILELDSTSDD
ncbi:MAG: hypothetical protein QNK23_06275 [Crocinitomicaceae bacterium]|nr:hypothetical protein [Crocinitomicaceae bacterium]